MGRGLQAGETFGDYRVVRQLGRGGMGEVWLLESAGGGLIAAKILAPDASADHESRKRFLREAELTLGVKHPNLVEVYDVGEDPDTGLCFILMEYISGGTLADYLRANGALPVGDAVAVVQAIASVLELGRQKGIVHRDIKPANIMFTADGTPKLADLGIARRGIGGDETTTMTQTGVMIGTPAYMSPEQMLDSHNVDTRADIYSLGVVFFEMLTGVRPNKDDTVMQLMAKAMKGEPLPDVRTLRPEISASLAQLLNMMVAPDKDGRISTPGQITTALDIIERGGKFDGSAATGRARAATCAVRRRRRRRHRFMLAAALSVAALVGLSGIAFGVWWLSHEDRPPAQTAGCGDAKPTSKPAAAVPAATVPAVRQEPRPVEEYPGLDEEVRVEVKESCAASTGTVRAWTAETMRELKRQMGTAYDEKLAQVDTEILICQKSESPQSELLWNDPGLGVRFSFKSPKNVSRLCVTTGWKGFPAESSHGHFVVFAAQMASGLHYDVAKAEVSPIAWGLKDALGLSVARRLGHTEAADTWLGYWRERAEYSAKGKGVGIEDVALDATLRAGVVPKNPNGKGDYVWIVEYRIAKLFVDLMRENPDVMRDYFAARNEYRRVRGGKGVRISPFAFATLLGQAMKRDMVAELNRLGFGIAPETESARNAADASRARAASVKVDGRVSVVTVGDYDWFYTLEGGNAVIGRGESKYSDATQPAIRPEPVGAVTIPSELDGHPVVAVGRWAFPRCRQMTSVTIPEGVTRIDSEAFRNCAGLARVNLPESLRIVRPCAFKGCMALRSVDLKQCGVFDGLSFFECFNLTRMKVGDGRAGFSTVDGVLYANSGRRLVFWPRTRDDVALPEGVETIGICAFHGCPVRRVSLPKTVRTVGGGAFSVCAELRAVELPGSVVEIGYRAFESCGKLQSVVIPASVRKVGSVLFDRCGRMRYVAFKGNAPALGGTDRGSTLGRTPESLEILVLEGSTGWKSPGSAELPKRWPTENMADSRPIRAVSAEEMARLTGSVASEGLAGGGGGVSPPDWGKHPPALTQEDVTARLKKTVVKVLSFGASSTIADAVAFFRKELGLNILLDCGDAKPAAMQALCLSDIAAGDALKVVCDSVDYKYAIHGNIVVVSPKGRDRKWTLAPATPAARALRNTRIPELAVTPPMTVIDVVANLIELQKAAQGSGKAAVQVNWSVRTPQADSLRPLPPLFLREVSVWDALDIVCGECAMGFVMDKNIVIVQPLSMMPGYAKKDDRPKSRFTPQQIGRMRDSNGWNAMRKATEVMFPEWRICDRLKKTLPKFIQSGSSMHGCGYSPDWCRGDTLGTCGRGDILETREHRTIRENSELRFSVQSASGTRIGLRGVGGEKRLEKIVCNCGGSGLQEVVVDLSEYAGSKMRLVLFVDQSAFGAADDAGVAWSDLRICQKE